MIQVIIGIAALVGLYLAIRSYQKLHKISEKQDELSELNLDGQALDLDEQIIAKKAKNATKEQTLNEQKEQYNVN